jgi:DNA-binding MarR family transcriptional regulator
VGTSAELARRTGVSAAAVSQLLGALEAAALVRRVPGEDRRRQDLALTEAGERALAAADATPARAAGRGPGRPAGPGG